MPRETRTPAEVVERMTLSYLAFERTKVEKLLASGEIAWTEADEWSGSIAGAPNALFGEENLESTERRLLMAPTGEVPRKLLMRLQSIHATPQPDQ